MKTDKGINALKEERFSEALQLFTEAAEEGEVAALTYLAGMYEEGVGVEVSIEKALSLFHDAAYGGDAQAQSRLGYLYAVGKYVDENLGAAVEFHKLAANQGYVNSQCDLGRHYAQGIGVDQDLEKARYWYEQAADAGDELALSRLIALLLSHHNPNREPETAIKLLEKIADNGKVQAQFELGAIKLGTTFPELKDLDNAIKWLLIAEQNGSAEAIFHIGNCYEHGIGVSQDHEIAASKYLIADKAGIIEASFGLGTFYQEGIGVEQDYSLAIEYYTKAANSYHPSALFNLGRLHQFGLGVPVNISKAHDLYLLAAERGHVMCQFLVAQNLLNTEPEEIEENPVEAVRWLNKAAEAGFTEAEAVLGFCLMAGKGTEKNISAAKTWSRLAAEKGHAWSQYRLAYLLLRYGEVTKEELMEALKWLIASYNQPDEGDGKRHQLIMDDYNHIKSQLSDEDFASVTELATNIDPT